jgi:hypothetical protein
MYGPPTTVTISSTDPTSGEFLFATVLQIPVSPIVSLGSSFTPTVSSDGTWIIGRRGVTGGIVSQLNTLPSVYATSATLDRPILFNGQVSRNFAILRPKPDETSVIINFRKSAGDVSQTILVPQDANDAIKASVGTIFQQLNVDLSNQNTNITQ